MAGIQIDGANQKLYLDSDADTYLEAATDDTIKFYVAGAHDLTISANAVNVLSGTTLTIDSGATITNSGTANGFGSADPSSADGDTLGTASAEWSDLYLADSSVIYFGNDQDTTLTHTDGTGLTLNSTNKLTFGDAASFIQQSSDGVLRIDGEATVDINASAAVTIAAEGIPVTVGGIPFFADASNDSIYTHNVSGTDSTATKNTAYGIAAMDAITTGDRNTAIGYDAGGAINSGANNQLFGRSAGAAITTGDANLCIGYNALGTNVSASGCTAIGFEALYTNKVASNIAIGQQAAYANDTGLRLTILGHEAYDQATAEDDNIVIGWNAMDGAVSGAEANVMIGNYAGDAITSGDDNTGVGHQSGSQITTGLKNTCVGKGAGGSLSTGDENVCLGRESAPAAVDSDNSVTLGSSAISSLRCQVQSISALSDERDKTDIIDLPYGLDFINSTRPIQFKWNIRDKYLLENNPHQGKIRNGFIAQELLALGNNDQHGLVLEDNPDRLEAANAALMPMMVKAVQELSAEVTTLKDEIKNLKGE